MWEAFLKQWGFQTPSGLAQKELRLTLRNIQESIRLEEKKVKEADNALKRISDEKQKASKELAALNKQKASIEALLV